MIGNVRLIIFYWIISFSVLNIIVTSTKEIVFPTIIVSLCNFNRKYALSCKKWQRENYLRTAAQVGGAQRNVRTTPEAFSDFPRCNIFSAWKTKDGTFRLNITWMLLHYRVIWFFVQSDRDPVSRLQTGRINTFISQK